MLLNILQKIILTDTNQLLPAQKIILKALQDSKV